MRDPARQSILGAIRHHLREARRAGEAVPPLPEPLLPEPSLPAATPADLLQRFRDRVEPLGVRVRVTTPDAVASAVAEVLDAHGARRLAVVDADDPLPRALAAQRELVPAPRDPDATWTADAGLTSARFAIAETGTLVLDSDHEASRLASLLPPIHVAVVPLAHLVPTMAEALQQLTATPPAPCITLITGPSRTADIELKLVVGVHGPAKLEILFVQPGPTVRSG